MKVVIFNCLLVVVINFSSMKSYSVVSSTVGAVVSYTVSTYFPYLKGFINSTAAASTASTASTTATNILEKSPDMVSTAIEGISGIVSATAGGISSAVDYVVSSSVGDVARSVAASGTNVMVNSLSSVLDSDEDNCPRTGGGLVGSEGVSPGWRTFGIVTIVALGVTAAVGTCVACKYRNKGRGENLRNRYTLQDGEKEGSDGMKNVIEIKSVDTEAVERKVVPATGKPLLQAEV